MSPSEKVIKKFGCAAKLSRALGHKNNSTVHGWKKRGTIPAKRHPEIFDAAERLGIKLRISDFLYDFELDDDND